MPLESYIELYRISIHTASEGGDSGKSLADMFGSAISIHTASEGGDVMY